MTLFWLVVFFTAIWVLGFMMEERLFGSNVFTRNIGLGARIFSRLWPTATAFALLLLVPSLHAVEIVIGLVLGCLVAAPVVAAAILVRWWRGEVDLEDLGRPQ